MKIAILTPTFDYFSGIDRVVQEQAESYSKKGNEVTVFALEGSIRPKGYEAKILGMPKTPWKQRLYRLFFFLDRKKMRMYRMLKGYDKIISHFYPMNWLASNAKKHYGIEYVYHNHGINTTGLMDSWVQKAYMKLFLIFNNITLRNVDRAYSVSEYLKKELKKESGLDSEVVYNKIDRKRFNPKIKGTAIRKKYHLENKKILLYVGRITPHKGVHLLLRAFSIVKKEVPDAVLLIGGKATFGSYFERLKRTAGKDVIFTGFINDKELPQYYAACDLYITASLWEGFDLPVAEAQACGKKVVAFDIGSHKEIVKRGKIVPKNDINGFAHAILGLLKK